MGELVVLGSTLLVIFAPAIYAAVVRYLAARRAPQAQIAPVAKTPFLRALEALIVAHSLFILYKLFYDRPTNIFTDNSVSLTTHPLALRSLFLTRLGKSQATTSPEGSVQESILLPTDLESLLARLQSAETRLAYVRFGHAAVEACQYCLSSDDFWLFSLPALILSYIRMLAVMGSLTAIGSGKRRWRWRSVGIVAGGFIAEYWTTQTTEIEITKDTIMVSIVFVKHILSSAA